MTHDNVTDIERRYLLQKRGLYYRPDRCGYTGIKEHAGRYFEHEASLPDVVAIHEDEAAEFSPSCYDDLARQHLQEQVASLRKQLEDARSLPTDDGWQPIAMAPVDESILCAVEVTHNKTGASWWEMHVISIDSETGEISSDNDAGWAAGDYTHWRPLPAPPAC